MRAMFVALCRTLALSLAVALLAAVPARGSFFCTVEKDTVVFKPDTMNRAIAHLNEGRSAMQFMVTSIQKGVRVEVLKTLYGGQAYRIAVPSLFGGKEGDIFAKDCKK